MTVDLSIPLMVGAVLFALGIFCLAAHRSAIRLLLGIELMLNAAIINFVAFGAVHGNVEGAVFSIAIMAGAAAEAAVGMALVFALFAITRQSDVELATELSK
ncbi:MAG: NADH-quinone oxidoreductase subunit NuoK [Candidatus Lindowbacteria bacterium]|nr:NADH-quinone oxidoreductase subunit NuoK [Candidatus Lindowbacteria bacterium]